MIYIFWSAIKQIYFNKTGKSLKAAYLQRRGEYRQKDSPDEQKENMQEIDEKMSTVFKSISPQVVKDFQEFYLTFFENYSIFSVSKDVSNFRAKDIPLFLLFINYFTDICKPTVCFECNRFHSKCNVRGA